MAANFWTSTQHTRWLNADVNNLHPDDGAMTQSELKRLKLRHTHAIQQLGQRLQLPQRVTATAIVYFRRFYVRRSYTVRENDPHLMIPTCLYLASKMEECPVRASVIVLCTGDLGLQRDGYPYTGEHVLANEFRLLEGLQFYLVVFHPYDELPALVRDAGLDDLLDEAWSAVNDSYGTDLLLLHPPHVVALACVLLVASMHGREQQLIDWFSGLDVDLKEVGDAAAVLLDMYTLWSETGSSTIDQLLVKFWRRS